MNGLETYISLFRGRADAYGSWDGGCIRNPLTPERFREHLTVGPHIGVYPSFNNNDKAVCVWGCTDIDYDSYSEARALQDALRAVDIVSWTEKTRRGWHVWTFSPRVVPSEAMRNMFLAAHQVVGLQPKEVNPKQTVLAHGQLGNYVRLPYPNGDNATERFMCEPCGDTWQRLSLSDFLYGAVGTMNDPDHILEISKYYQPPVTQQVIIQPSTADMKQITDQLTPLGWTIFQHGPLEGRDRSTTLAHLTHECVKSGIAAGDALKIMEDADLRWGKYMMRGPSGLQELEKLIVRAYGMQST
jgi:hypothetical protein